MRVLLALDESKLSLDAARTARRLFGPDHEYLAAQITPNAPSLMVGDPAGLTVLPASYWDDPPATDPYVVQERVEAAGIDDAEVLTDAGDPVRRICRLASEHDVDVIVVGAHEKGFWRRLMEPSVSSGVLHLTDRPVLVVPEREPDVPAEYAAPAEATVQDAAAPLPVDPAPDPVPA